MRERRCFVQFIHPGGEHGRDSDGLKGWNRTAKHKRKFLRSRGRYMTSASPGAQLHEAEIVFWGEWEPPSEVSVIDQHEPDGPRFLHTPFFAPPLLDGSEQNTDPFVFGRRFLYTGCQQHTGEWETQLRWLQRGSLILFGSCRDRSRFVLDAVFVVSRYIDHRRDNHRAVLRGKVPRPYRTVTIDPWYAADVPAGRSHRLYFGATPARPVGGMFSFFPCRPYDQRSRGFPRPAIEIPELVNPGLVQGRKQALDLGTRELKGLWDDVVEQVLKTGHGLTLGVHAEMPRRRTERGESQPGLARGRC